MPWLTNQHLRIFMFGLLTNLVSQKCSRDDKNDNLSQPSQKKQKPVQKVGRQDMAKVSQDLVNHAQHPRAKEHNIMRSSLVQLLAHGKGDNSIAPQGIITSAQLAAPRQSKLAATAVTRGSQGVSQPTVNNAPLAGEEAGKEG